MTNINNIDFFLPITPKNFKPQKNNHHHMHLHDLFLKVFLIIELRIYHNISIVLEVIALSTGPINSQDE